MKRPPPSLQRERFLSLSRHIHRYKRETPAHEPEGRNERANEVKRETRDEREDLSKLAENLEASRVRLLRTI